MSLRARKSVTACFIFEKVTFLPPGPETATRLLLILVGAAEHPFSAARNATLAASNAVPSKPVYGFAPFTERFQRAWNAPPAGPPAALAAVPPSPTAGLPMASSVAASLSASVISVFEALHLPERTSEGANFWNVAGKSMITQPAGLPATSCWASVSNVGWSGFQASEAPTLSPSFFHWAMKSAWSAVPECGAAG